MKVGVHENKSTYVVRVVLVPSSRTFEVAKNEKEGHVLPAQPHQGARDSCIWRSVKQ